MKLKERISWLLEMSNRWLGGNKPGVKLRLS